MLTLVIPVRDWPAERIEACARSFASVPPDVLSEILVVDFGSGQPVSVDLPSDRSCRVLRLEADVWSPGEAANSGILLAANAVVAKADADILFDPRSVDAFIAAAQNVAACECGLLLAQPVDLPTGVGVFDALEALVEGRGLSGALRSKWGQGGLAIFRRDTWGAMGGFDARFTGWGGEDNDFADRTRRSGRSIRWADREALRIYHVAHPPTRAASHVARQWQSNVRLARSDQSVYRPLVFLHSNALSLAAPNVIAQTYPLVTLAIATSARPGRDRMIEEAVGSFRGQIDNDFEVAVLDNGSSIEAHAALQRSLTKHGWIPALRLERSLRASIPAARNAITDMARGRYICIVDDDDIALPNRLADHVSCFAADGTIHGSHGGWIDFDETTGQIERNEGKQRTLATLTKGKGKTTAHPACLYRTDVLRALPYDQSLDLGSDLDLALRMAAMGLRIDHTGSFVTLRRFHATNVTISGQRLQATNGVRARERLWASFSRNRQDELLAQAMEGDECVPCGNHLSMDELAELLPDYVGEWRLVVPISAIEQKQTADSSPRPVLEALFGLMGGDIGIERNGADEPIVYLSDPIRGLAEARRLAASAEALTGERPAYVSTAQQAADRSTPFEWSRYVPTRDACVLRSTRFEDLAEVLVKMTSIKEDTLLRQLVHIVSDADDAGPCYFIATSPIGNATDVRALRSTLLRLTSVSFQPLGPNGRPGNPLLFGDKLH